MIVKNANSWAFFFLKEYLLCFGTQMSRPGFLFLFMYRNLCCLQLYNGVVTHIHIYVSQKERSNLKLGEWNDWKRFGIRQEWLCLSHIPTFSLNSKKKNPKFCPKLLFVALPMLNCVFVSRHFCPMQVTFYACGSISQRKGKKSGYWYSFSFIIEQCIYAYRQVSCLQYFASFLP